jgi:predicted nuclease of restriction endonuclease-like (RecB) superfamily
MLEIDLRRILALRQVRVPFANTRTHRSSLVPQGGRGVTRKKSPRSSRPQPSHYAAFLADIKARIHSSQLRAATAVNSELTTLYWDIGAGILQRQRDHGWGAKVIDNLSRDLRTAFPDMKGFSPRNLKYMRAFAEAYPDRNFVQATLAQITWYHNIALLTKVKKPEDRAFYLSETIRNGWTTPAMIHHIDTRLHLRRGKAVTNFPSTLPDPQSGLAANILKDPYTFDFLTVGTDAYERDLEHSLIHHIEKFLLELGVGFAFVARQHHIQVADRAFSIDLLFYHCRLHCYVVVDLKATEFDPEHAGKMNFYLSAVDHILRHDIDNPTIGLIICKEKNSLLVEYALKDINKPIGVSSYQLTKALPKKLKGSLPTIKQLEQELHHERGGE